MKTKAMNRNAVNTKKSTALIAAMTAAVMSTSAHATLITFDDISAAPVCSDPEGFDCAPPQLNTQYAHLGVLFGGGASVSGPDEPGGNNVASDWWGPGMTINFTGVLPTAVSMNVSALYEESVYLEIYGAGGLLTTLVTDGWRGTEELSTPYQPNQLMSFAGAEITQINIGDFFFRRGLLTIDNLNFTSDPVTVPEPSVLSLLFASLGLLWWQRRRLPA